MNINFTIKENYMFESWRKAIKELKIIRNNCTGAFIVDLSDKEYCTYYINEPTIKFGRSKNKRKIKLRD